MIEPKYQSRHKAVCTILSGISRQYHVLNVVHENSI